MANHEKNVCPGCSRHCAFPKARCKYGQKYFAKMQNKQAKNAVPASKAGKEKLRYKWEKYVAPQGLFCRFLTTSSRMKSALRKKAITEQQILSALDCQEQARLAALLKKIADTLDQASEPKDTKAGVHHDESCSD